MSERVVSISSSVSTAALERAVIRLDLRRHPEKLAVIDRELRVRLERKAA